MASREGIGRNGQDRTGQDGTAQHRTAAESGWDSSEQECSALPAIRDMTSDIELGGRSV